MRSSVVYIAFFRVAFAVHPSSGPPLSLTIWLTVAQFNHYNFFFLQSDLHIAPFLSHIISSSTSLLRHPFLLPSQPNDTRSNHILSMAGELKLEFELPRQGEDIRNCSAWIWQGTDRKIIYYVTSLDRRSHSVLCAHIILNRVSFSLFSPSFPIYSSFKLNCSMVGSIALCPCSRTVFASI